MREKGAKRDMAEAEKEGKEKRKPTIIPKDPFSFHSQKQDSSPSAARHLPSQTPLLPERIPHPAPSREPSQPCPGLLHCTLRVMLSVNLSSW